MKKILAFSGSNSSTSINQQLLDHVLDRIQGHEITKIRLTDYSLPIFSEDIEKADAYPESTNKIKELIQSHEALVIAVNEHNNTASAFFKNFIDWMSRLDRNFLEGKKILLFSTSPGKRGAASSLEYTKNILPRFGGNVLESFSFPSFKDNFQDGKVINEVLDMGIEDVLSTFSHQIEN